MYTLDGVCSTRVRGAAPQHRQDQLCTLLTPTSTLLSRLDPANRGTTARGRGSTLKVLAQPGRGGGGAALSEIKRQGSLASLANSPSARRALSSSVEKNFKSMRAIWWEQGGGLISPRRSLRFCHKLQSPRQGAEKLGEAGGGPCWHPLPRHCNKKHPSGGN